MSTLSAPPVESKPEIKQDGCATHLQRASEPARCSIRKL